MRSVSLMAEYPKRRWTRRRTVTVSRRVVAAVAAAGLLLTMWSGASVWYLVSRDEVALRFLERQAQQKRLYEEKLLALRAKLEEVTSQRMVEQEVLAGRLQTLLARQAAFETRQAQVRTLAERTGSIAAAEARAAASHDAGAAGAPSLASPVPDIYELRLRPAESSGSGRQSRVDGITQDLELASSSLAALEAEQIDALHGVAAEAEARGRKLQAAIRKAGVDPGAFDGAERQMGGPLIAPPRTDQPFEAHVRRAEESLARLERLHRSVSTLPFGEPIDGEIDLSSGYGIRVDPFTRSPAMHTGLDFRAEYGAPVRAAGAGRIAFADYSGAYGYMVEIEHPHGVSSRYAHLSSIAVAVGQEVKAGAVLGRVGSTGRSTGPHLHYETRLNGDAVDPQRFLKAGASIADVVAMPSPERLRIREARSQSMSSTSAAPP